MSKSVTACISNFRRLSPLLSSISQTGVSLWKAGLTTLKVSGKGGNIFVLVKDICEIFDGLG